MCPEQEFPVGGCQLADISVVLGHSASRLLCSKQLTALGMLRSWGGWSLEVLSWVVENTPFGEPQAAISSHRQSLIPIDHLCVAPSGEDGQAHEDSPVVPARRSVSFP